MSDEVTVKSTELLNPFEFWIEIEWRPSERGGNAILAPPILLLVLSTTRGLVMWKRKGSTMDESVRVKDGLVSIAPGGGKSV
jgi:hypothetical protein